MFVLYVESGRYLDQIQIHYSCVPTEKAPFEAWEGHIADISISISHKFI